MNRSKVRVKMFFAYIGILCIPILFGIIIYAHTLTTTRNQGERINLGFLEITQKELDKKVEEISTIAQNVALDSNIQRLAGVKGRIGVQERYMMYEMFENINRTYVSDKLIQDIFIYFNNIQYVVGMQGAMPAELYYDTYFQGADMSAEQFKDYMGELHYKDMRIVRQKNDEETMLFTITNMDTVLELRTATITVVVNLSEFQPLLKSMKWNEEMSIAILDDSGKIIFSQNGEQLGEDLTYSELVEGNYQKQNISGTMCAVAVKESDVSNWKYITVIPDYIFEEEAIRTRNVAVVGLFACILTGFLGSWYFTKKNYNPIKNLTELMAGYSKQPVGKNENEFQWLKKQTELFFQEKMDIDRILHDNRRNLKNYYLFQLLESGYRGSVEDLIKYGIDLGMEHNLTVVFDFDMVKEEQEHNEDVLDLGRFIVMNVFKEMISEYFKIEMVGNGQSLAAIISIPTVDSGYDGIIRKCIDNVRQLMNEKFDLKVTALVGALGQGLSGIHISYTQAEELREYVQLLEEEVIVYEDVKTRKLKYNYAMESEEKIINAIKVGEAASARAYMEQVFEENLSNDVSIDTVHCLTFEMMGTLIKGAEAADSGIFMEKFDFSQFLSPKMSIEELKERFFEAADSICNEITEKLHESEKDKSLSRKVEGYIQDHYADFDLNISIVAQYFDLNPSYMSYAYKKQTGRSLLDYINTIRMDKAEELLKKSYSVVEVAAMIGFRDSGTFIRAFKKKKGITPGQLKKNTKTAY